MLESFTFITEINWGLWYACMIYSQVQKSWEFVGSVSNKILLNIVQVAIKNAKNLGVLK
jgi:hypothetical protein